jgi:probable HAF family extracellular repeat protein
LLLVFGLVAFTSTALLRAAATFTPLGLFGGTLSEAADVSGDGRTVVGFVFDNRTNTSSNFRWTALGTAIRSGNYTPLPAVSGDGSVAVGGYFHSNPLGSFEAFRWTADGMFEGLGDLPGGPTAPQSQALDVSADGSVIVGEATTSIGNEAFRWTRQTGMVGIGQLPAGATGSAAFGVSSDGAVIVGEANATGRPQAFRWTAETGMVGLGFLPGAIHSISRRVSGDGSVVVGVNSFPPPEPFITRSEAFRWTQSEGMVSLGDLPGGRTASIAYDVSADGAVIVGTGFTVDATGREVIRAFHWTAETGMLNLQDLLVSAGATNLDGWALVDARGVSADGLTIVGVGAHNGREEAWVATIPEPATIGLAAIAAAALLGFRLRNRSAAISRRALGRG